MNTWKRCNKCTPKATARCSLFWPNRMLSDSVILKYQVRPGVVFTINWGSAVFCTNWVQGMYCELLTKFFCHWFMAALWSGLAINQWRKWGSVTLRMDWEYEASKKFYLSERLIGIWEREHVREVYWNMASKVYQSQCMYLLGDIICVINIYW